GHGDDLDQKPLQEVRLHFVGFPGAGIRADIKDARVALGQRVHHVERGATHAQNCPSADRITSSSSSVSRFLWCHLALFSAGGTPLPLTVWQMIALGRRVSSGSLWKAPRSAARS